MPAMRHRLIKMRAGAVDWYVPGNRACEMLLRYMLAPLQSTLAWLPDWAVGLILLVLAALAAAALHALTLGLLRRSIAPTQLFVRSLLTQTTAPTRFALVIFALGAALRSALPRVRC